MGISPTGSNLGVGEDGPMMRVSCTLSLARTSKTPFRPVPNELLVNKNDNMTTITTITTIKIREVLQRVAISCKLECSDELVKSRSSNKEPPEGRHAV